MTPTVKTQLLLLNKLCPHDPYKQLYLGLEEAIRTAMSQTSSPKDAVIIAGKGADAYQIVNGEKAAYDGDLEVAKQYL